MSQLLETIKCKEGKLYNLHWHNLRINQAIKKRFGLTEQIDLGEVIRVPESCGRRLYRCRVLYGKQIDLIEFVPHQYRKIESLRLVKANKIDYKYKYANRDELNELFERRSQCDDILIVKNGYITDSFTANPIFYDGTKWLTSDTPLLAGIQRSRLLSEGKIFERRIRPNDLPNFSKAGLINALWDMHEMPTIDVDSIAF